MTQLIYSIPYLIAGVILVTLIDVAGAWASKRFHFNIGVLAFLSFAVYIAAGFIVSQKFNLSIAFLISLVIAFYDATLGWKLSKAIKPHTGLTDEQLQQITASSNLTVTLVCAFFFTYIGYLIA